MPEHTSGADAWIRRFHQAPAGTVRLICFPHAGGAASYYFPVSQALANPSPVAEVLAIQYPGRQDRRHEPPLGSIEALADGVATALTGTGPSPGTSWVDTPVALFGHSLGAVLAFEVAARLERIAGLQPLRLFVSGRRAPSEPRADSVHRRDDDGLLRELRRLSGTDSTLLDDDEVVRMILPALRADYRAVETYRWAEDTAVSCPITALVGDDDPMTTTAEAAAWRDHTAGDFDVRVFAGGHFYLNTQAAAVIEVIAQRLRSAPELVPPQARRAP